MSVIVSRALPDVRDGLKPSQRRILVAMNDLNLSPGAHRVKCAKISGDTSGNYHPHGESVIYPTLVRMAQEWNMREVLVDKQGNFGSIAGLPPAAMRYTEARLSSLASLMLEDIKLDTVDFVPTYDESRTEPTVLPAKLPNLLINGANGIAVGMATSIPPHNLEEICNGLIHLIDHPEASIYDLFSIIPGPDFPTGGIVCGQSGIRRSYLTGRCPIILRAKTEFITTPTKRTQILVREIPYQQSRDRIVEKIASLVNDGRIPGISAIRDESDLKEPVRLIIELKKDAEPEVVLNQLFQYSPLQDTFSVILLALVDGQPRTLNLKEILEEHLRHRITVIRRRTQFLLAKARKRKHTVEGLLLALADIDQIIKIIRSSKTQAEAKNRLVEVECPSSMMARALGDEGFKLFQEEHGIQENYHLTGVQADAILKMTLGQLVNLEQERLSGEHHKLLEEIKDLLNILSSRENILAIIRKDLIEIRDKYGSPRRTLIDSTEVGNIDLEDLIEEENMVVTISHRGYIKRTPTTVYRAQRRGGTGLKGAKADSEDPIEHLFVASTHAYMLFFTNKGKVYWEKVYDLPQGNRDSKGRAIIQLLNLDKGEKIADCRAVRDFDLPGHYMTMATRNGLVKKTLLEAYSRPKKGGIIAIKLRDDDELIDVTITKPGDEIVLATDSGMTIRFREDDARAVGRNSMGVRGIALKEGDCVVGMVVADPDATLLTVCENGFGKRTLFGPNAAANDLSQDETNEQEPSEGSPEEAAAENGGLSSSSRYRTQRRGGKGIRDIKTTTRNGKVVGIVRVDDNDDILLITTGGKLQRLGASDVSTVGRNTQGVRIMRLKDEDQIAAVVRLPKEENGEDEVATAPDINPQPSDLSGENIATEPPKPQSPVDSSEGSTDG